MSGQDIGRDAAAGPLAAQRLDHGPRHAEDAARVRLLETAPAGGQVGARGPAAAEDGVGPGRPGGHARGAAVGQEGAVAVDVGDQGVDGRGGVGEAAGGRQGLGRERGGEDGGEEGPGGEVLDVFGG